MEAQRLIGQVNELAARKVVLAGRSKCSRQKRAEAQAVEARLAELRAQLVEAQQLTREVDELAARKAALEEDLARLRGEKVDGPHASDDLDDLRRLPVCLLSSQDNVRPAQIESDALEAVKAAS